MARSEEHALPRRAFVVCPNYHGATLLATVVGGLGDVVHLGDTNPHRSADYPCSCGQPISSCPFWQRVRSELELEFDHPNKKWMPRFPDFTGRHRIDWALTMLFAIGNRVAGQRLDARFAAARAFRSMSDQLWSMATEGSGAEVMIDGEKSLVKALFLSTDDARSARVVHLVRDPRGFAFSSMERGRGDVRSLGRDWRRSHLAIGLGLRLLPRRSVLTMRYEDVAADPQRRVTRRLADFLGVAGVDRPPATQRHFIGNTGTLASTSVRVEEKWRSAFDSADAQRILRDAGRPARRLGYEA